MSVELDRPVRAVAPEAAISTLICLLHQVAVGASLADGGSRLEHRIFLHMATLAAREDMPALLRQTCDELSDAWQMNTPVRRV